MTLSEDKLWIVRDRWPDDVIMTAKSNHSKCAVSKGGSTAAFVPPVFILSQGEDDRGTESSNSCRGDAKYQRQVLWDQWEPPWYF